MNPLAEKMKKVWETTVTRNAHLGLDGEREDMLKRYEALVTSRINVNNKTIIDFGCGGGLLGVHLLNNFKVKKYIAYDLATRSLKIAMENLREFNNTEFNYISRYVWDFAEKKPDIIICLAVIIHFPTQVYLDNFLKTCNESGAKKLVLEIRDTGKGNVFQKNPYASVKQTILACNTNEKYVSSKLTEYSLIDKTDATKAPTNCQVLWYEKKKANKE